MAWACPCIAKQPKRKRGDNNLDGDFEHQRGYYPFCPNMRSIATHEEFEKLLKEDGLIVVDFFATWCGPCKMMGPVLEEWEKEYSDVKFVKVDVDENPDTAEHCDVNAMPTFHLYKGGKKVEEMVGANKEKLKKLIDDNL